MKVPAKNILTVVAEANSISVRELTGKRRTKRVAHARQEAMFLLRRMRGDSLKSVGFDLGQRDHTTVMYGVREVGKRVSDPEVRRRLAACVSASQCPVLFRRPGK